MIIESVLIKIAKLLWRILPEKLRIKMLKRQGVIIGNRCSIAKNVIFGSEPYLVSLGDDVRLTSNVQFITHDGGMWVLRNLDLLRNADKFGKITIGNNVNIGWNVVIMPGVVVGNNVVIGVGSIVTKNVADNSIVAGIPAKVISSVEEYYNKNLSQVDYTKHLNRIEKKNYLLNKFKDSYP